MRLLTHILPACGANLGGLVHIRVYPASNVLYIPDAVLGIVADPVTLEDPENYCDIFFPVGEGILDEPGESDGHGEYFKPKLSAWIPKDTPEFYDATLALMGMKCVCIAMDANSLARIVGTPDHPLRFRMASATGRKGRDKNGMDFEFFGALPVRSPFYLSMEFIAREQRKVFSSGFTFGYRRK